MQISLRGLAPDEGAFPFGAIKKTAWQQSAYCKKVYKYFFENLFKIMLTFNAKKSYNTCVPQYPFGQYSITLAERCYIVTINLIHWKEVSI